MNSLLFYALSIILLGLGNTGNSKISSGNGGRKSAITLKRLYKYRLQKRDTTSSFIAQSKYSNKQVIWYEYPYWLDGTLLSDPKNTNKFNDILFKKVGDKYYKAQGDQAYNIKDWGIRDDFEHGDPDQNSLLLQAMIDYFPEGYTASIYIPTGHYHLNKTVIINRRPFHVFGDNGTIFSGFSSTLIFPPGLTGIAVQRGGVSIQEAILERFCLIAQDKGEKLGTGIVIQARATLRDITVKGFSENGIAVWANMTEGSDASGSLIEKCHSLENGLDGFFIGRTDANAITVIACDARDNGRYGFNEDSFIGSNYISCMTHYNKAGDFYVRDKANAHSLFEGCYSEGGNKTSQLGPHSTVVGGIWGSGYSLNGKDVLH